MTWFTWFLVFFDIKDSISNYVSGSNELLDCDTNVNICSSTVGATDAHSIVSKLSNCSTDLHKHQKNPHENNNTNIINTMCGNNYTNTCATNWNRNSNINVNSNDKSGTLHRLTFVCFVHPCTFFSMMKATYHFRPLVLYFCLYLSGMSCFVCFFCLSLHI